MSATSLAGRRTTTRDLQVLIGAAAHLFPAIYLISNLVEVVQGDFSTFRLSLTYVGEAGIPLLVLGLCAAQRPKLGIWGVLGALTYAYAFVFFTGTVLWALVARTPSSEVLGNDFGWWMTVHGAVMVVGGVAFGLGAVRAEVFPAWTGYALAVGVLLVAAASGSGNLERALASAVPDAALAGMGLELLLSRRRPHRVG